MKHIFSAEKNLKNLIGRLFGAFLFIILLSEQLIARTIPWRQQDAQASLFQQRRKKRVIGLEQGLEGQKNIIPFLIIGGGPAGMSAAIYASRSKVPTLLIDDHEVIKGEASMVENWPGLHPLKRKDLFGRLKNQAEGFGATVIYDSVEHVDLSQWPYKVITKSGNELLALSIIAATGSHLSHTPIENESEYWGRGIAPCSYCDAPRAQGKEVIVCGNGTEALIEAMNIAPYAHKVKVILGCTPSDITMDMRQQERLNRYNNLSVEYQATVKRVDGDSKWIKEAIIYTQDDQKQVVPIDMLFISSTRKANSDIFSRFLNVDRNGYVQPVGRSQQAYTGFFVAGELQDNEYRQAAVAAGDGIKAAIEAIKFLQEYGFDYAKLKELKDILHPIIQEKIERELIPHLESTDQFERVQNAHAEDYLVVMFHAHGCHYCHEMMPIFHSVAASFKQKDIKTYFYLADVQSVTDFIPLFDIDGVPLFCIFYKGKLLRKKEGVMSEKELRSFLDEDLH